MKINICVPSARFIETETVVSIYNLDTDGHDVKLRCVKGYAVDVSRTMLVEDAIENNADYILWIDDDQIPPIDTLKRLLSHGKDIVTGLYVGKNVDCNASTVFRKTERDTYNPFVAKALIEHGGLYEIDACGMGCCLTSVEALKKIGEPWFKYSKAFGEDIFFCRRAQEAGFKIYVDTDVHVGHMGIINFTPKGVAE